MTFQTKESSMDAECRLVVLEKEMRRYRLFLICSFGCVLLFCAIGAQGPFRPLVCGQLEIKNPNGTTVVKLSDDGNLMVKGVLDAKAVPLGMMLPFFGKEIPEGFVLANGRSRWPEEAWVPDHLHGKEVPNMEEELLGGAADLAQVGTRRGDGTLTMPGHTVDGASFSVQTVERTVATREGEGFVFAYRKNKPNEPASDGGAIGSFNNVFGNGLWVPYLTRYAAATGVVGGKQVIGDNTVTIGKAQSPPYWKCRWIIRIK
jgi:hypothetical protein